MPTRWTPFTTPSHDVLCDGCFVHTNCAVCRFPIGFSARFYFQDATKGTVVHATCVEDEHEHGRAHDRRQSAELKAIPACLVTERREATA